mmetsp:Transcript_24810/g.69127  ORF Transcript_24810/g.69127 Transcript_24810/m.69127 type:complete len:503 (+) Transcript_24810:187-1695(+)
MPAAATTAAVPLAALAASRAAARTKGFLLRSAAAALCDYLSPRGLAWPFTGPPVSRTSSGHASEQKRKERLSSHGQAGPSIFTIPATTPSSPSLSKGSLALLPSPGWWPARRAPAAALPLLPRHFSFASAPALCGGSSGGTWQEGRLFSGHQPLPAAGQQHSITGSLPCSGVPGTCRKGASGVCLPHMRRWEEEEGIDADELLSSLKDCYFQHTGMDAGEATVVKATVLEEGGREAIRDSLEPSEPLLWHPKRDPGRLPAHVTFYKRELPQPSIAFSSAEGKRLWTEALLDGNADCYFKLSEQFITQAEPAYCGLTSLAMVLNTLSIDPRRTWKGVWRWYVEDMVSCCTSLENVQENGVTFQQVANLAQCNGADVEVFPYDGLTLDRFRELVLRLCRQDETFLIVSYSRGVLNQTGDGHFSPVGGYNAKADRVLILDVVSAPHTPKATDSVIRCNPSFPAAASPAVKPLLSPQLPPPLPPPSPARVPCPGRPASSTRPTGFR